LAGIIERTILDYQAPLYGRATASIRLLPLPFGALAEMLPHYKPEERVAVQAVTGSIPAYVELFDDRLSVQENLAQRIVTPANAMLNDAAFLLHEQLGEPRNYMAIIEAIAAGYHGLSDIARMAGISRTNIVKYLGVLADLGYVERQVPATVRRPEKSRQGRYVIVDAYLRFYYRFLAPNLGFIERGMTRQATALIENQLVHFIGTYTFEELCREWMAEQADMGALPFLPERIGSFWSREAQVDVVAINWRTRDILLGECKWGAGKVGQAVIRDHFDKTSHVVPDEREWQVHYLFFAREGFTAGAQNAAEAQGAQLITLDRLEADMRQWAAQ
jgi:AAA+ ATPase superfamily predicted ATPase